MSTPTASHDQWDACSSGELRRMVELIRTRRRREFLRKVGTSAAGMMVVGAGGYFAAHGLLKPTEHRFGGIACNEVMRLLDDYRAKRLDPKTTNRISVHLAKCPHCGPYYRRMIGQTTVAADVRRVDSNTSIAVT